MTEADFISLNDIIKEEDVSKLKTMSIRLLGEYLRTLAKLRDRNQWLAEEIQSSR